LLKNLIARPLYVGAAVVVLAFAVGQWLNKGPAEPETTIRLVRHVAVVFKDRPVVHTSFVDRIIYKTTKPDTVWKTLPGEVDTLVQNFCSSDTMAASERLLLLSGRVEPRRLTLYGFTNHGVAYHATWPVMPTYQFVADQDSVVVQSSRIQFHIPSGVSYSLAVAAGIAIGRWVIPAKK
jgi:hypothetical protein